jgi:hypothetical protein
MCFGGDEDGVLSWESSDGAYSMYFRLQGAKNADTKYYNIYRDGVLIQDNVTDLTYTDATFDSTKPHLWAVKTVCADGSGVSAPASLELPAAFCRDAVSEFEVASFSISPNPSSNNITIATDGGFIINTVDVVNFLGQTVISQSNIRNASTNLDISKLNSGVYFVRITSENGTAVKKFVKQ